MNTSGGWNSSLEKSKMAVIKIQVASFVMSYTEFIKPGVSMESRRFRTGQKNIWYDISKVLV